MERNDLKRWLKAILVTFIIFAIFSVYLFARREIYNLYIVNKALASTAAVLAGLTLIIGPVSKKIASLATFMTIRRHLGLLAMGLAIVHVSLSLVQQNRFPFPQWYVSELIPVVFGLLVIVAWSYMTYISRNKKIEEMGVDLWKSRLSLAGKIGFIAIFLHLTLMKYPGWIRWWNGQIKASNELANPSFPPASLFVFAFALIVIVYRLVSSLTSFFRK